jgi:hypothetical protein
VSEVRDLAEFRARRVRHAPPDRAPDFVISGWMNGESIEWLSAEFEFPGHRMDRAALLIDAAWLLGRDGRDEGAQPAFWWVLDTDGRSIFLKSPELRGWRSARWFVNRWWSMTRRCAAVAWRMARGA